MDLVIDGGFAGVEPTTVVDLTVGRAGHAMALAEPVGPDGQPLPPEALGALPDVLVGDGETIILDSGSTTTEVAANLFGRSDVTVITNALNIALLLGADSGIEVIVTVQPPRDCRVPAAVTRVRVYPHGRRIDDDAPGGARRRTP